MEMSKKKKSCFEKSVYFLEFMFLLGAYFFLACKTTLTARRDLPDLGLC